MDQNILIVDDEPVNILLLKVYLKSLEYNIIPAEDGYKALDYLKSNIPHLVLLDIMMPGLNGIDVLTVMAANERLKNIPVIVISGDNNPDTRKKAIALGAKQYLYKPIDTKKLTQYVEMNISTSKIKNNS